MLRSAISILLILGVAEFANGANDDVAGILTPEAGAQLAQAQRAYQTATGTTIRITTAETGEPALGTISIILSPLAIHSPIPPLTTAQKLLHSDRIADSAIAVLSQLAQQQNATLEGIANQRGLAAAGSSGPSSPSCLRL